MRLLLVRGDVPLCQALGRLLRQGRGHQPLILMLTAWDSSAAGAAVHRSGSVEVGLSDHDLDTELVRLRLELEARGLTTVPVEGQLERLFTNLLANALR